MTATETRREAIYDMPSGLVSCRADGVQMHIECISPYAIWLRSAKGFTPGTNLHLIFYCRETADYDAIDVQDVHIEKLNTDAYAAHFYIDLGDCPQYARAVRRISAAYADAVRSVVEGAAASDVPRRFCTNAQEQLSAWRGEVGESDWTTEALSAYQIAFQLDDEAWEEKFLRNAPEEFWQLYCAEKLPAQHPLTACRPRRAYLGSELCDRLSPSPQRLTALVRRALDCDLALTLNTAQLRVGEEERVGALLELIADDTEAEVAINDWGMLELLCPYSGRLMPILGTQLNKRRKDPRAIGMPREDLLADNDANGKAYSAFLAERGIERYEYESCGMRQTLPAGRHSLHLPFYTTNRSLLCPLYAYLKTGKRGAGVATESCGYVCRQHTLMYPDGMHLIGRGNAILGFDTAILRTPQALPQPVLNIDRLVLNG